MTSILENGSKQDNMASLLLLLLLLLLRLLCLLP